MKGPVNDSEPDIDIADDISQMKYFKRNGAPLDKDLFRVIAGDMSMNVYRDPVKKIKKLNFKKVAFQT